MPFLQLVRTCKLTCKSVSHMFMMFNNFIYKIIKVTTWFFIDYKSIGCYKDTGNRAIPTIEGKDSILDGSYGSRQNAIAKCAVAARKRGFQMFAVQNGGWCATSATAEKTFDKYGKSNACKVDGEGGPWANEVYIIQG